MARSRRLLQLGVVIALAAALLAGVVLSLGALADDDVVARPHAVPDDAVLAFEDDFDDGLDDDVWGTCHWWEAEGCTIASNDELQLYWPDNVDVDDGVLRLEAHKEATEDSEGDAYDYTSGMVSTGAPAYDEAARYEFTYGYVEARLRLPAGQGLWPAFWLLPASQESRPEIDIVETLGHRPDQAELHYHYVDDDGEEQSAGSEWADDGLADGDWHEFAVDWAPGRITWIIDGTARYELTGPEVSDEPMYVVLNLAVGGEWPGDPDDTTRLPAAVEVDWVRVWQEP